MWLHRKTNNKYNRFQGNVERWWVEVPMFITSGNSKGFQYEPTVIGWSGDDDRFLWQSVTYSDPRTWPIQSQLSISGNDFYSCDVDRFGYTYFSGTRGTLKRDIMTDKQIWGTSSGTSRDNVVKVNSDYVYIGSNDSTKKLKKLDLDGVQQWSVNATMSVIDLGFDSSNNIYCIGIDYLIKFDTSGSQVWSIFETRGFNSITINNDTLYCGGQYGSTGSGWSQNGAVYVYDTSGNKVRRFGAEVYNRDASGQYSRVEMNDRYFICLQDGGGYIDVYNKSDYSFTASLVTGGGAVSTDTISIDQDGYIYTVDGFEIKKWDKDTLTNLDTYTMITQTNRDMVFKKMY